MAAPVAEEPAKRPRKVSNGPYKKITRRSEQGLQSKKESDRRRGQTRITIGTAFPRWRALKKEKGLRADTDVALLLLDSYERYTKGLFASTPVKAKGKNQSQHPSSVSRRSTRSRRYEARSSISLTITGTCVQEPTTRQDVSTCHRDKLLQNDETEHQSGSTQTPSEAYCIQDSFEEMEVTIDEDECNSVENRLSDSDGDVENFEETPELSAAGADDSGDEDVYVPIFPQRTKASELLLECEEEELQPWQKQTSHVHLKVEEDDEELSNDQTDIKPDSSLLQMNARSSSPQTVKTETPQPTVYNNQGFIVVSPQLTSNTEFIGSLGTQCYAGNSFTIVPAAQQQLFQKVATPIIKSETCEFLHTSEVHPISNNAVSLSSVQSPTVYAISSNQQQSDQSNSQSLPVPFPLPCFTLLELNKLASQTNSHLVNQDNKL